MAKIIEFKCPNCLAPLKYDPASGKFKCEYCDGMFDQETLKTLIPGAGQPRENAEPKVNASKRGETETIEDGVEGADVHEVDEAILYGAARAEDSGNWDVTSITEDWGDDKDNIKGYICPSCGAGLICDKNTVANSCPYCGNTTISEGDVSGSLKPEYIIPFSITPEQARQALLDHYKGKFLLPSSFRTDNALKELKGIYVPFWLFDGEASGAANYQCTIKTTYRIPKATVHKTRHYNVQRGGDIAFKHIPTDAAKKMPDDVMDSIEPYDYSGMVPFNMSYLSGFFADKYDVTIDENSDRADIRCRNTIRDILRETVSGYTTVSERGFDASIHRGAVHYAMLPVYMLRTHWRGQDYIFAVNGQTGKTVGDLPSDPKKTFLGGLIGWGIGSIVAAIIVAIGYIAIFD